MGLVSLARAPETAKFVLTGGPTKCSDGSTSKPRLFASTSTARGPLLNPPIEGWIIEKSELWQGSKVTCIRQTVAEYNDLPEGWFGDATERKQEPNNQQRVK
jgi:hypothetical protein